MKLTEYAKNKGVTYRTAWNHYKLGLIPGARKTASGTIIIDDINANEGGTVIYARVSSMVNKSELISQSKRLQDFCAAKGWIVASIVEEYGSALDDNRGKINHILSDRTISRLVIEHKNRLTRFGFEHIKAAWVGEIVVINDTNEADNDFMIDFEFLITLLSERMHGKSKSLIAKLKQDIFDID